MFIRIRLALGLAFILALVFVFPAFAGGWAVITLDELPTDVVAGEPLTIGFTVRQHGITPMNDIGPTVTATLLKEDQFTVYAEADGKPGHYIATLTFPTEGNWEWSIQAFTMDQTMPTLVVIPSSVALANQPIKTETVTASISPLLILGGLVFGMALVGVAIAFRRKSPLAVSFAGLCLVAGIGIFVMGITTPEVEAQGKSLPEMSANPSPAQAELGRQLFLAKGCITCHYNDRAADRSDYWTIEMGAPDLSNYSAHPEVLFIRLKDPVAAKSDAKMPNLELKKTEIEALIAFINSK